jgi:hypothetical protein
MSVDTEALVIGRGMSHLTPVNYWDGLLDEIVIFNDVLTANEIDSIRMGIYPTAPGKAPIKLHHYKMAGGL